MQEIRLSTALKAAVLAGLLGGLALGLFHLFFTEPVIDKALALEQQFAAAEAEIVSRSLQKIGLIVGTVLLGGILGAMFAGPYALLHNWLPGSGPRRKALFMAALGYWSIALFPFLKYPANPPGVGDPETATYRQALYLGFIALSVMGTAVAVAIYRLLGKHRPRKAPQNWLPLVLGGYLIYAAALYRLMPPNPDQIRIPLDLVWQFRWLSIAGLTLLWLVLGGVFSVLWEGFSRDKLLAHRPMSQAR